MGGKSRWDPHNHPLTEKCMVFRPHGIFSYPTHNSSEAQLFKTGSFNHLNPALFPVVAWSLRRPEAIGIVSWDFFFSILAFHTFCTNRIHESTQKAFHGCLKKIKVQKGLGLQNCLVCSRKDSNTVLVQEIYKDRPHHSISFKPRNSVPLSCH